MLIATGSPFRPVTYQYRSYQIAQAKIMSWLAECTPPGLRGRTMSLRLTGNRLGQVVIPSVVGFVAVSVGAAGVLRATAGTLGAVAVAARRLNDNPTVEL